MRHFCSLSMRAALFKIFEFNYYKKESNNKVRIILVVKWYALTLFLQKKFSICNFVGTVLISKRKTVDVTIIRLHSLSHCSYKCSFSIL